MSSEKAQVDTRSGKYVEVPENIDKMVLHKDEFTELWCPYTVAQVNGWAKKGIVKTGPRGFVYLRQSVLGVITMLKGGRNQFVQEHGSAKNRVAEAQAEMAEIELKEKLESIIDVEQLGERMEKPIMAMKQVILAELNMTAEAKEEVIGYLQELFGCIFGKEIKNQKLKDMLAKMVK